MKTKKVEVKREFPSEFGSHSVMIDEIETDKLPQQVIRKSLPLSENLTVEDIIDFIQEKFVEKVVCRDQFGQYVTERFRINNNMSDPNRWAGSRVKIG